MTEVKPATKAQLLSILAAHELATAKQARKLAKLQRQAGRDAALMAKQDDLLKQMKELLEQQNGILGDRIAEISVLKAECVSRQHEIEDLNKIIQQMSANLAEDGSAGTRESRAQKRSPTPDSIALIVEQGREPVTTTVTTIRPKLRSPPRLNRR